MRLLISKSFLLLVILGLGFATQVFAGDRPNVLVFNEDSDEDAVPAGSRIHKRVLRAIDEQLGDMGIATYDEVTVGLDQGFAQGRTRRSDGEIIDIARSVARPPIDVAVIYTTYASVKQNAHINKVKVRIEGRMLNVKTGRNLGAFELKSPKEWTAPVKCNRECIIETVGDDSRIIANDVGAVLAEKLAWMVDGDGSSTVNTGSKGGLPMAYTLEFDGFSQDEMMKIEEYLVIFSGYKSHRPIYSGARRAELWYESSIGSAKLNRNLNKMLDRINLRGMVQFSGNTASIKKITLRGKKPVVNDDNW